MILNVSGRTDIIAFYSTWFINRYQQGFVDVRNPFSYKQVSRIFFKDVDGILFCTKNPIPFLTIMDKIKHPYFFHVTLTPYQHDIEPNVPDKKKVIEAIKIISKKIGVERIFLRYDPILLNPKYTLEYHCKAFEKMCRLLEGYVKYVIVSFIDIYKNVLHNAGFLNLKNITKEDMKVLGKSFSAIARKYGMTIQTCAEEDNLLDCGFIKRDCLDEEWAHLLTGQIKFKRWKARGRESCQCVQMVDIGFYNSCKHYCKYCYANYNEKVISKNVQLHDNTSSLLIGHLNMEDVIKVRKD
ncbi:MAG: DUF1848 domain-containing protein [Bacilli bacterium]|nr:DUF1848 domain-containing protein [Bacilli bacterium]